MVQVAPAPGSVEMQKVGSGETNLSIEDDSLDEQCMKHSPPDPGFFEKGNISNIITFLIMVAGLAMRFGMDTKWEDNHAVRSRGEIPRWGAGPTVMVLRVPFQMRKYLRP